LAKVRVYELARELSRESKDVLAKAGELGVTAKTASSSIDESDAALIRLAFDEEASPPASVSTEPEAVPEPAPSTPEAEPEEVRIVTLGSNPTVTEFADAIGTSTSDVVKALILRGVAAGAGQPFPLEHLDAVAEGFGVMIELEAPPPAPAARPRPAVADEPSDLASRPPVVTVMGHVDHGKTTLLDTIRRTKVVASEKGGITQHIGAYQVEVGGRTITFIDTPGHSAFSALRARGANVTDIVVLVVAADDGVMPQSIEAISHSRAAGVKMVVAINKIDLPGADPLRVRTMLTEHGVITEELGGDVPSVEVSALTGQGVDQLLELIDLIAQIEGFSANPKPAASGVVIEAELDPGMGPLGTVIVQRGTLRAGDAFVAGTVSGKVRAMLDHAGGRLKEARPSTPVRIMGWAETPIAGDDFRVVASEREARAIAEQRAASRRDQELATLTARQRLENLLDQLRAQEAELRLIVKADAHGSLEALRDSVGKIKLEGGRIDIVHGAVGGINENDVTLAEVTAAVIIGFNVRPDGNARRMAEQKGIEIRTYGIIYELLEDIEQMLAGRLAPEEVEAVLGSAQIRALFRVPRVGTVAGCYVTEGEIVRGARARLLRDGVVIFDGRLGSLKRFKDDVRSVGAGYECGLSLEGYNDVKEGDIIEVYQIQEVART
jgi:translation initiation factor IF-2